MSNDYGGLRADRLRVKVNQEGKAAGRFVKYGGQVGWKNKGGEWTNRFVELMVGDGTQLSKGDVVQVTGRVTFEDREYQGKTYTNRTIWVDSMQGHQPSQQPQQQGGRDQAGFPADTQGMDQLPF